MSTYHKVTRLISERIYNKPLLITQDSLNSLLDYLETRTTSITAEKVEASLVEQGVSRSEKILTDDLAIIPITGSLSYEASFLSAMCGLTSYEGLVSDVREALSLGIKNIVFRADSSGGEAFAMMSSAELIRKLANENGAKIYTYIDGKAASACYGLIAVSDEIIAHPDSQAGSIGVVIQLMNNSEKLKKEGYSRKFITSTDSKVPFNDDGEFKSEFIADLQESVNDLHAKFVAHVAKYRPMSADQVDGLKAKVFSSEKSLSLGLIDKVMDHSEFQTYLEDIAESSRKPKPMGITSFFKPKAAQAATQQEDDEAMKLAELQAQYDELSAKMEASVSQLAEMQSTLSEATAALQGKDAELQAALSELQAIKTAEVEKVNAAKMAKLAAVYGDDKAAEMFADLSALPEATFDAIVSAKRADNQAVEQSPMFQEMGVTVEDAQAEAITQEDYLAQRLAAKAKKQ